MDAYFCYVWALHAKEIFMKSLVEVVVSNNSYNTDRLFTYEIGDELDESIGLGQRVLVPFGRGNKPVQAYVFKILGRKDTDFNVKKIIEIADYDPILTKKQLDMVEWMRENYICTYMDCINAICPKGIGLENYKVAVLKNAPKDPLSEREEIIIGEIQKSGSASVEKLTAKFKSAKKIIAALEKRDIIEIVWEYKKLENKKYVETVRLCIDYEDIDINIERLKKQRAHKQAEAVEFLRYNDECIKSDLKQITGASQATIKSLLQKGIVEIQKEEYYREPDQQDIEGSDITINDEQKAAVRHIEKGLFEGFSKPIVLHGVTGSGKTQVYIEAIEKAVSLGKECIMLVPEIALTPQTVSRFKSRFGEGIAVIHSGLSAGEKYDQWRKMKKGHAKVCIGARSAIFSPFENIGLVIIDEFHESSYKSEMSPKYDTIELSKIMCNMHGAGLVLGSATPSVKEYYMCKTGEYDIIRLEKRANNKLPPKIELIDMKREIDSGNRGIFSRRFLKLLGDALERKEQAMIFLNRRGYSNFVYCAECGFVLKCKRCDISMTYHKDIGGVKCHYCGHKEKMPQACPECGENALETGGMGTQRVVDEIKNVYPQSRILRMDRDTTSRKGAHSNIIQKFRRKEADILIGTQMISKGHDFPNVTFVGVVSADATLNYPDYKSSEKTFQLITQVSGRAGRASLPGIVALQAHDTAHYSIQHAKDYDYEGFYDKEIRLRKTFGYEPFGNILSIVVSGRNKSSVMNNIYKIHEGMTYVLAKKGFEDFSFIMGPSECPMAFINMKHRWQMVIRDTGIDIEFLKKIVRFVCITKRSKIIDEDVNVSIDINPSSIM